MIYKIHEQLSNYLIAPDGTAVEKKTGSPVLFERSLAGITAKLVTDERMAIVNKKKQGVNIVRRFTREQLLKAYAASREEFNDTEQSLKYTQLINSLAQQSGLPAKEVTEVRKSLSLSLEKGKKARFDTTQQGVEIHEAIVSGKPVNPGVKAIINEFIEEASYINPEDFKKLSETLPSEEKKITVKAGKKAKKEKTEALSFPFFRINGKEYQSARKASKELGISVNTVLKRAKANKDGWFYIESEKEATNG